ncbi:MAG: response regulator transcription factor [Verrucomicrobia bacterium]|nr:response regulator transcription factor [Verrucomicrobiota bacterium]
MSAKKNQTKILLIDDHPLLRNGIAQLIAQQKDLVVCGEVDDSLKALDAIELNNPEVVILDITLKKMSGIEVLKHIKVRFPKVKVLILSMHDETLYAPRALRAGASGYIMKQEAAENVITAIRKILSGEVYISERMATQMLSRMVGGRATPISSPVDLLSDRELEVFTLLGKGDGTRDIAEKLNLSVKTIESHRAHIKEKLNLKNATELVRHAVQWVASETVDANFDINAKVMA